MHSESWSVSRGRIVYGCTFAVCFLIFIFRGWVRLSYPNLWAEDANVFFTQALQYDFDSLKIAYAGSYHTIQRLIVLGIVHLLPTSSWAFAVTLACFAVVAGITAAIARIGHEWLIPSTSARVAVAMALCFAPGYGEMLGNVSNINWQLLFWVGLLALRDPKQRISCVELTLAVLISISIGTMILLVPLFAWRVVNAVRTPELRERRGQEYFLLSLTLVTTIALVLLNRNGVQGFPRTYPPDFLNQCVTLLYEHMLRLLVLTPWFGLDEQNHLWLTNKAMAWNWISATLVVLMLIWYFIKNWRPWHWPLLLFAGGIAMWPALNLIARAGDTGNFMSNATHYSVRYSYPLSYVGVIFWLAVFRPTRISGDWRANLGTALIVLNLIGNAVPHPRVNEHGRSAGDKNVSLWEEFSPLLDSAIHTGCPLNVTVPAYPAGWGLAYSAPDQKRKCPEL